MSKNISKIRLLKVFARCWKDLNVSLLDKGRVTKTQFIIQLMYSLSGKVHVY